MCQTPVSSILVQFEISNVDLDSQNSVYLSSISVTTLRLRKNKSSWRETPTKTNQYFDRHAEEWAGLVYMEQKKDKLDEIWKRVEAGELLLGI